MNRRDFLKVLGISAASIAAPKIIFDIGANSRIYAPRFNLVPYCLYAVDGSGKVLPFDAATSRKFRIGVYQPNGEFYFGNGLVKVQMRLIENKTESVIIASMTSRHPVGSIY